MSGNVPEPLLDPEQESSVLPGQALRTLLRELVRRNFLQPLGITDSEITSYVSDLLAEFSRTENLYRIRDSRGQRLEDVGQMLAASDPLHEASSFEREREVRKHIGDFTLFFAGLFPEALNHWRLRRQRLESLVDFGAVVPSTRRKRILFHRRRFQPVRVSRRRAAVSEDVRAV